MHLLAEIESLRDNEEEKNLLLQGSRLSNKSFPFFSQEEVIFNWNGGGYLC